MSPPPKIFEAATPHHRYEGKSVAIRTVHKSINNKKNSFSNHLTESSIELSPIKRDRYFNRPSLLNAKSGKTMTDASVFKEFQSSIQSGVSSVPRKGLSMLTQNEFNTVIKFP
mmetsp:Transcript_19806/g.30534  ORF Transcript_19806/g.30534 Transcript_19806/m.30534 type:complete len:113 (-) Transcript_19806:353-691(-)